MDGLLKWCCDCVRFGCRVIMIDNDSVVIGLLGSMKIE